MNHKVKEVLVGIAFELACVLFGLYRLFCVDITPYERNLILYAAIPIVSALIALCALAVIYYREGRRSK